MSHDLSLLAERLDDVVRAVPGVRALYSAVPAIVTSVRQLGTGPEGLSLVEVRAVGDGCEITANIGVESAVQGPRTAAAVSSAILAALAPGLVATVHVRISRILD